MIIPARLNFGKVEPSHAARIPSMSLAIPDRCEVSPPWLEIRIIEGFPAIYLHAEVSHEALFEHIRACVSYPISFSLL